jgi:hypothetical protein
MDLKHLTGLTIYNSVSIHVNYNIIYRSVTISINFILIHYSLVFIDYNRSTTNNYMSKV